MAARRLTALLPLLAACAGGGPTWSGVPAISPRADPIVAAFHVNWDPASREAVLAVRQRLDWVIAEWAFLADDAAAPVRLEPDTALVRQLAAGGDGPRLVLMVSNAQDAAFDGARVERLLADPRRRARALDDLVGAADRLGCVGVLVDFEGLVPTQHEAVLAFVADLHTRLARQARLLLVAVPAGDADWPFARYAASADLLVPMLYDEHHPGGPPGPVASLPWFEQQLGRLAVTVPPGRLLPGIATYGYLWRDTVAVPVGFAAGQDSARQARSGSDGARQGRVSEPGADIVPMDAQSRRDRASGALAARWRDREGVPYALWQSDERSVLTQAAVARRLGTAGIALWRLGAEDAALRRRLDRRRLPIVSTP